MTRGAAVGAGGSESKVHFLEKTIQIEGLEGT